MLEKYKYTLRPFLYEENAFEPIIDAETISLHRNVHLQKYIDGLNIELDAYPSLKNISIDKIPAAARRLRQIDYEHLIHYVGGVYCHNTYFDLLIPPGTCPISPCGGLDLAIKRAFGSFDTFVYEFREAASKFIGSGWIYLLSDRGGRLYIYTSKQNNLPDFRKFYPILILDLWEHSYYLKYRYAKSAYIEGFFQIINWDKACERYDTFSRIRPT